MKNNRGSLCVFYLLLITMAVSVFLLTTMAAGFKYNYVRAQSAFGAACRSVVAIGEASEEVLKQEIRETVLLNQPETVIESITVLKQEEGLWLSMKGRLHRAGFEFCVLYDISRERW